MLQTVQEKAPRTTLRCVSCGKLYEPGQRIEVVDMKAGKVLHLECKAEKDGSPYPPVFLPPH